MRAVVKVNMDPETILRNHGLGDISAARRFLAEAVRRRCDKYVPYDTGMLKNTAFVAGDGSAVTYIMPYAAEQFYEPYRHKDPNRGDQWHKRMLRQEGAALLSELADYLKGGAHERA